MKVLCFEKYHRSHSSTFTGHRSPCGCAPPPTTAPTLFAKFRGAIRPSNRHRGSDNSTDRARKEKEEAIRKAFNSAFVLCTISSP